ncbi:hypothetical protein [Leptolyngbya sp. NIES-2104]|uniref:hypothetical protein n=1 Tax=Leptolyngbya sp. NIES-2104 TaxID=1552121 RepID=UPI0006EC6E64|nr:hypothetical protein [Leptolyngbya sp. NIES-2104]GAP99092.1 hypothetical protein NIES2104_56490 [Leptolyngbya sp. NIES-2104]
MNPKSQSTYQNTSQTTSRATQYYDDSSGKAFIRTFLKILYVLGCLAALYFAYLNINPYVAVVGKLLGQTDVTGFGRFIGKIPLIGGVARALG